MCRPFRAPNIIIRLTQGVARPWRARLPWAGMSRPFRAFAALQLRTLYYYRPTSCFLGKIFQGNLSPSRYSLHPRFRFASPGVTHGAASTRLRLGGTPPQVPLRFTWGYSWCRLYEARGGLPAASTTHISRRPQRPPSPPRPQQPQSGKSPEGDT